MIVGPDTTAARVHESKSKSMFTHLSSSSFQCIDDTTALNTLNRKRSCAVQAK